MTRIRFAPSPTGLLHIGGSRTALFNWLYAKHTDGKFILRIEDTDKARSKKEFLDEILDSLKWLGMDWDEIYFQSERFPLYKEYAEKLLSEGKAYQEGPAIILKVIHKGLKINDLIHGEINFDTGLIKDQVLIKSDGSPTYNFACVLDDALMQITHVIRGDDHISNTPKQILIYEALGFSLPNFAHVPLILNMGGGRLSKRTGATAISDYRKLGYLAEAIVNYLMLLGWSPGDNKEIITTDEAIKKFDIKDINKTAAVFDLDKLNWINNQYLKLKKDQEIAELILPLLKERYKFDNFDSNWLIGLVKLLKERVNTLEELVSSSNYFFLERIEFDEKAKNKLNAADLSKEFNLLSEKLKTVDNFSHQNIEQAFRDLAGELNIAAKVLIHPVRAALTGVTFGPGLFELMEVLGKEKVITRLKEAVKLMSNKSN